MAAILLVLGIGQRTFLAPPTSVKQEITLAHDEAQYVSIPAEVFQMQKGNPSVVITGENVFLSLAEQRDVDGWLSTHFYGAVSVNSDATALEVAEISPEASDQGEQAPSSEDSEETPVDAPLPDPRGSDLWLAEYAGETSLKVAVSPQPSQAVLVTSGADSPQLPNELYVIWAQERSTPLAGPLLAAGGLFAILGVLLYLFAIDYDRRGLGPRRGRKGPFQGLRNRKVKQQNIPSSGTPSGSRRGSKLGFVVPGLVVASLTLTACSPSYWPQAEVEAPTSGPELEEDQSVNDQAVVPVTEGQLETILQRVVESASAADEARDASLLEDRFTGPALEQRTANYLVQAKEEGTQALPFITTNRLQYDLVQSTEKWPRSMFITVESSDTLVADEPDVEEDTELETTETETEVSEEAEGSTTPEQETTPTLVLLLKQMSPHENFQVHHVVSLRGGIEMPAAAPVEEGTAVLSNDIKTLLMPPGDVAATFAEIMQTGEENIELAASYALEGEMLLEKFGSAWAKDFCKEDQTCSVSVESKPEQIVSLSTGQGGALMFATIIDSHTMEVDDERKVLLPTPTEEAFGLDAQYSKVTRTWQHEILFYVPTAESTDPIQVLGSQSQVIGATGVEQES